jgi:hypothetical protein
MIAMVKCRIDASILPSASVIIEVGQEIRKNEGIRDPRARSPGVESLRDRTPSVNRSLINIVERDSDLRVFPPSVITL